MSLADFLEIEARMKSRRLKAAPPLVTAVSLLKVADTKAVKLTAFAKADPAIQFFVENGLPPPEREFKFHPGRKWRMDYAWSDNKLALEKQGGIWTQGRHTRGAALLKEWEKLNEAAALGWRFIFVQPSDLMTVETMDVIRRALNNPS